MCVKREGSLGLRPNGVTHRTRPVNGGDLGLLDNSLDLAQRNHFGRTFMNTVRQPLLMG